MATVARDLRLHYRLGITQADNVTQGIFGAVDPSRAREMAGNSLSVIPYESVNVLTGAYVNPVITTLATNANVGLITAPYEHVYDRIWVVADHISTQNPALLTNIPFKIWNAFLVGNTLTTITPTGATGLTLSISAPLAFLLVEEKTVNLQVTSAAPPVVDAHWLFTFTFGSATFDFDAILLEWIKTAPEMPVIEMWEWYTNTILSFNGSEQRIGLRAQPRRRIEYPIFIRNEADRREWYHRFYLYLSQQVLLPFYQYFTLLSQDSSVSSSRIYFDPAKTDFRANDYAVIFRPSDETSYVLRLTTLQVDGADLLSPLTQNLIAGDFIAPAFFGRLQNMSGIKMKSVSGQVAIGAFIIDFRSQFNRPGSAAVIVSYDGMQVLNRVPVVTRDSADELLDVNPILIDNKTGVTNSTSPWLHAKVQGGRQFVIARRRNPTEMDYYRDFLTNIYGSRDPFLLSTFFEDLVLSATPSAGSVQITVQNPNYALNYFAFDTYKRFQFTNPNGDVIYRKATAAVALADNTTQITLDTPLPVTGVWGVGFTIFYLNKVHLAADDVKLTHTSMTTLLDMVVRTTDD